ncbi:type I phosphomannose isomerase catalytic subunit [Ornithobacterium rhinotracheale]|uniref:type I phosphomannose isomerase catalytic subunit n=1 Tax=Ornithobacterium rhinotracheale TaxID=28251 RepID=UPI003FA43AA9
MKLYPIKFEPILMDKVWGGEAMQRALDKKSDSKNLGESWEISDVQGNVSVVANGEYQGENLRDLILKFPKELIGKADAKEFPILIKFLDANVPLSIQVHPNEELAQKMENSHGKTEMWYIVDATDKAEIYLGWKEEYPKEELIEAYKAGNIKDYLKVYKPKKGEFYFVPAGSIHALGGGLIVAEIQQTSDVTYRIYDWGRTDRELHIPQSIEVTDYTFKDDFKLDYGKAENSLNPVIKSEFFQTVFLNITDSISLDTAGSYDVLMCVEGKGTIVYPDGETSIQLGETILIPAALGKYELKGKDLKVLKVKA